MANDLGAARSNYFHVHDADAFGQALSAASHDLGIWVHGDGADPNYLAVYSDHPDTGCWPSWRRSNPDEPPTCILTAAPGEDPEDCTTHDHEDEQDEPLDLVALIAPHVVETDVVVLMEAGFQKLRYVFGNAVAFNHTGDTRQVNLNAIYDAARELGEHVTYAEY